MNHKALILIVILLAAFFSCEKQVILDIEDHEPRLVINSVLHPGQKAKVYVGTSGQIYQSIDSFLTSANVVLYANETPDTLQQEGDHWYYSSVEIEPLKKYRITASYPGYPIIEATETIPPPVSFRFENYTVRAGMNKNGMYYSSVDVVFTDPPNQKNHYMFWAPQPKLNFTRNGSFFWGGIWSNDPQVQGDEQYAYTHSFIPFSDALFDGKETSITIHFYYGEMVDAMQIHLRCLSENQFNYTKSLIKHKEGQFADVLWGVTDPVGLFSNIKNGYGIFAGYSTYSDSLIFQHNDLP